MAWIETEDGYVNLATAQRIAFDGYSLVVDQAGASHPLAVATEHLGELLAPVVPGSGVLHCIHSYDPPGTGEPKTFVETHPIVAWRVTTRDGALPIVPGRPLTELSMSSYSMTVIEMPDGGFAEVPGVVRYESFALAREALVERVQKALGKRHSGQIDYGNVIKEAGADQHG